MRKKIIKLLTLSHLTLGIFFSCPEIFAAVIQQEQAKTHLRWNLFTSKENIVVEKRGNRILLKTLNTQFYDEIKKELKGIKKNSNYIKRVVFLPPSSENNVSTVEVILADSDVEVFNFYRERDQKHVFDFWKEGTDEQAFSELEKTAKKKKATKANLAKSKKDSPKEKVAKAPPLLKKPEKAKTKTAPVKKKIVRNSGYRDYRYGASFVWDYDPFGPDFPISFDLRTKTPEHFYPIKNREYSKSEKEAHLQLAINLYRKKKYGLMYKSIKLFQEKYGADEAIDTIEYLKANAILRDNINGGKLEPVKMAINMLSAIASRTKDYELQKAIYKYLFAYHKKNQENVEALSMAKRFYVSSKENFDYEESQYAAEAIIYNLAQLNQVDKVSEVINEKTIRKLLPKSKLIAYEIYVNHRLGHMEKVIDIYNKKKAGLAKPVDASILFNVAEALFRLSRYKKATELYDSFITNHSYHTKASHARLRLALIFEITEKDIDQTIVLYKNAINRSQDALISAEARIRYAALRSIRKKSLKEEDLENRAFLDIDENIKLTMDHKRLLWLVRLRSFIVDGNYEKALTYLAALPLTSLRPVERRVFEADGAEIVYGILQNQYEESEYSQVVKSWNKFKTRYVQKVANDSYMNFIVGKSYLNLGLYEGFEELYKDFEKLAKTPSRTFPLWIPRRRSENTNEMLLELEIVKNIKLKNWKLAKRGMVAIRNINNNNNQINYYAGLIAYAQKDYKKASGSFEMFLSNQKTQTIFDPMELAGMINKYTDGLYQLKELTKFQNVTEAILADTKNYALKSPFMKSLRERLEYLNIEILAGKRTAKAMLLLEPKIKDFLKKYANTDYQGRCNYLLGMALAKNKKPQEAKKLFEKVLQDENTPASIKELVRSELSLMAIKERTI